MRLFFLILLLGGTFKPAIAQKQPIFYEQLAIDFFLDSIMTKEYSNVKLIYCKSKVNNEHSYLKSPIGFVDYNVKIDSLDFRVVKMEQEIIQQLDLSAYILELGKWKNKIQVSFSQKLNKAKLKKSIQVEIFKRYIYKPNCYIVEIKVWRYMTRTHYFIEIDNNGINRWYKTLYIF